MQLNAGNNAVDPDIDTLPLLAWSADMLSVRSRSMQPRVISDRTLRLTRRRRVRAQTLTPKQREIVRVQHWLLFPVLLLARVSWCMQSIRFPFNGRVSFKQAVAEVLAIAGHYAILLGAAFTCLPPAKVRLT